MSTNIKADAGTLEHDSGSVGTSPTTQTPTVPANFILITNTHATQNILVSFDAGSSFYTIKAGISLSLDTDKLISYQIKGSGASTTFEAIYGSEK